MNFLAHLWLADRSQTSLPGSVLGDLVRGTDLSAWPADIAEGIRLHRRIDARTDHHPVMLALRAGFEPGRRRYAGIVLDLVADHVLARQWPAFHPQDLPGFAVRCGVEMQAADHWFRRAGARPPSAIRFAEMLGSYVNAAGIDRALQRVSQRLSRPQELIDAGRGWPALAEALRPRLGELLEELLGQMRAVDASGETAQPAPLA